MLPVVVDIIGWRPGRLARVDQADKNVFQRTLARMQVLEVDAESGEPLEQVPDAGFLLLGVKGVDQCVAALGQLQRKPLIKYTIGLNKVTFCQKGGSMLIE